MSRLTCPSWGLTHLPLWELLVPINILLLRVTIPTKVIVIITEEIHSLILEINTGVKISIPNISQVIREVSKRHIVITVVCQIISQIHVEISHTVCTTTSKDTGLVTVVPKIREIKVAISHKVRGILSQVVRIDSKVIREEGDQLHLLLLEIVGQIDNLEQQLQLD